MQFIQKKIIYAALFAVSQQELFMQQTVLSRDTKVLGTKLIEISMVCLKSLSLSLNKVHISHSNPSKNSYRLPAGKNAYV
jgi:hypothetical protein